MNKFEISPFYCPKCGKKAMELPRQRSLRRNGLHRKKLYCPWCKEERNLIECRTMADYEDFMYMYSEGLFKEEVMEVMA